MFLFWAQTHFQWECMAHCYASIKIAIFKTLRRLDTTGNFARSITRISTHSSAEPHTLYPDVSIPEYSFWKWVWAENKNTVNLKSTSFIYTKAWLIYNDKKSLCWILSSFTLKGVPFVAIVNFPALSNPSFFFLPVSPCELHCRPVNEHFSEKMRDAVTDGTPCNEGNKSRDMCINGICQVSKGGKFFLHISASFHCTTALLAMQCIELTLTLFSLQVSLVHLTFWMKMSLSIEQTAWLLSVCSCLSPQAKMPVTDTDTVWIPSGQQSQTLGSDFMTFCDIFVRQPHFPPSPPDPFLCFQWSL